MRESISFLLLSVALFLMVGCAASGDGLFSEPTAEPTITPIPTFTPAPTRTPTPEPVICADVYWEVLDRTASEWDDAVDLANSTPRMQLSGPIGNLQAIKRNAERLEIPECAASTHEKLVEHMDQVIEAFIAFIGDRPDATVERLFDNASEAFDDWGDHLEELYLTPIE